MAMKKGGLGKGLTALLVENQVEDLTPVSLKLTEIIPNKDQPRHVFNEQALRELADSIEQHGILQPLLVRPMADGSYQLVAGERRWRAAQMAGLRDVPVVIREMTEQEAAALALIENLQREDLNPMEEAQGFRSLMETYKLTQEETAAAVGKSRPAVTNALRLLNLPDTVADFVSEGKLSAGHARAILAFDTRAAQIAAAEKAVADQLSVRAVEKMAQQAKKAPKTTAKKEGARLPLYAEVELALSEQLGRKVKVQEGKKGGLLTLEYYDDEDLKALANRFTPADAE